MASSSSLPQITYENETPGVFGSLVTVFDPDHGIIRGEGRGFWSVKQINDHFTAYRCWTRRLHGLGHSLHAIIDLREAAPQCHEVTEVLRASVTNIYRLGDRVAMVVPNSLVKMQMRRLLTAEYHEFFLSMSAAENWVFAHSNAQARPAA